MQGQIGHREHGRSPFGPFGKLETVLRKDVTKPSVFPFTRIMKPVKVEVPDVQGGQGVRLDNGIGRALDATLHTQGTQQVAHQGRLARTQVALECNERTVQGGLCCQGRRKGLGRRFGRPGPGFYNGFVQQDNAQFDGQELVDRIPIWARELGFSQIGIADVDLTAAEPGLLAWLSQGYHGDMAYMASHGLKRARPAELVPGTVSVITARMDYLPRNTPEGWQALELQRLQRPAEGVVSVYARGRDYHKVMRNRLQKLSDRIAQAIGAFGHRVFTDSAPVLEAELAARSGQGWRGKHTLLISREAGSLFFLGEIYVDVHLPRSQAVPEHCGNCSACMQVCPTQAIVAPYRLDARRCISYLTIEHAGAIPVALRAALGNRIYGCDDCQLVCPWNKFAQRSTLPDFDLREGLSGQALLALFDWTEAEFLQRTEGSPIRRIGHERWQRNLAVALGNALRQDANLLGSLRQRADHPSDLVREHLAWALEQAMVP